MDAHTADVIKIAFGLGFVLLLVCSLLVWIFFGSRQRDERNAKEARVNTFTTEGVNAKDELESEFAKLVTAIAYHNLAEKSRKCPGSRVIGVEEDAKNAFLQAIEEVYLVSQKHKLHCGIGSVLDRIQQLTKKYSE